MKKIKLSKIRRNRIYDARMLQDALGVHRGTLQRWIKEGLEYIQGPKPYKVWGADIVKFLENRWKKTRCRLKPDELYCMCCKEGREPRPGSVKLEKTRKKLGKDTQLVIIRAICNVCGAKMSKVSSERRENERRK